MNSAATLGVVLALSGAIATCGPLPPPSPKFAPPTRRPSSPPPHPTPQKIETPDPTWTGGTVSPSKPLSLDEAVQKIWFFSPPAKFRPSTGVEKEKLGALFRALIAALREDGTDATIDPAWAKLASDAGLSLDLWSVEGAPYWAIVEPPEDRRGAGAYLLRVAPWKGANVLLEVPHVYYDLGTEQLGATIFFKPPAGAPAPRALFTNTVHRYQNSPNASDRTPANPADICHNADHLFTAATVAFTEAAGGATVVELHGFADNEPEVKTGLKPGTSVVVSGGVSPASPVAAAVAKALKPLDPGVHLFPDDAKALGATTNVQGAALARVKGALFVHVEMSASARRELTLDGEKRDKFAKTLLTAATE